MSKGPEKRFNEKILIPITESTRDALDRFLEEIPDKLKGTDVPRARRFTVTSLARRILNESLQNETIRHQLYEQFREQYGEDES